MDPSHTLAYIHTCIYTHLHPVLSRFLLCYQQDFTSFLHTIAMWWWCRPSGLSSISPTLTREMRKKNEKWKEKNEARNRAPKMASRNCVFCAITHGPGDSDTALCCLEFFVIGKLIISGISRILDDFLARLRQSRSNRTVAVRVLRYYVRKLYARCNGVTRWIQEGRRRSR